MKKRELILHIGMFKTGTSTIQNTLHEHPIGKNFCYFKFEAPNHSMVMISMFYINRYKKIIAQKNRTINNQTIEQNRKRIKKQILENIKNCPNEKMIISGEFLTEFGDIALKRLKEFFNEYFHKITIIAYIRSPKSYIESAFQETLKGGNKEFNLEERYPFYRKNFEKFDKIFGKENVILVKFQRESLKGNDIVKDFFFRMNLEGEDMKIISTNESMPKELASLFYLRNKYKTDKKNRIETRKESNKILKRLRGIKGKKLKFHSDLVVPILSKHIDDIKWMEQRLGTSLEENMLDDDDAVRSEDDLMEIDRKFIRELFEMDSNDFDIEKQNINSMLSRIIEHGSRQR